MLALHPFAVNRYFLTFVLLLLATVVRADPRENADAPRAAFNFNSDWLVKVGDLKDAQTIDTADTDWKRVTLPHAWNEDSAFKVSIDELPTGIAWYRKHFKLPAGAEGKKVFIEFQGVRHAGEVYLNGQFVGRSENGVMAFGFDLTDKLKPAPQENILAVAVDNSWTYREKETNSPFQWNDKNFYANYGGINKNVVLHITNKLHQTLPLYSNLGTTGVYVYAKDIDLNSRSANITVEAEVQNEDTKPATFAYEVTVSDREGKIVKTFAGGQRTAKPGEKLTVTASSKIDDLHFWSWGYGYLYTVVTTLNVNGIPVDSVQTRTGFRKTEFTDGMLKLNGRPLQVHGYAQRTTNEWPALGVNVPPWVSDYSNELMVQSNGNLVRWMHVTPSKQDVESCDRVGLIQAMPAADSEGDPTGRRWDLRVLLMRDAIIYNRNNPSIIFYETGNKGVREEHMKEMVETRNRWDPHGGRAMGAREMLDTATSAEYGGEMLYINKSAGKPLWAMEYCRDEGLRRYADELTPPYHRNGDGPPHKGAPAPSYNHNQDSFTIEQVNRWYDYWRERPGTGIRVSGGGVNIIFSDSNTHHRGAENYRRSGEVDAMRLPKDAFYAHQVIWDGWVNIDKPAAHIVGHWNYPAGTKKDIVVVSSADRVEVLLNGQSLGKAEQSNRFLFTIKSAQWQAGTLKAVGYSAAGQKVCETEIATTGEPAAIKLTPHTRPGGMRADGSDLVLVDVEVVDAQGRRVPTAFNDIAFDLSGPAEWRGGIAQGPDNCILAKTLPVELGINRVIVRSTSQPGVIELKATSNGIKPDSIRFENRPINVIDGLSINMPDEDLKASLSRGPTPAGDGLIRTRLPVKVAKVSSTSNNDKAALTIDDNETTAWSNDGTVAGGAIRFDLAHSARVSEVTMKLGGWRSKSYPIRILVDKQVVFTGTTPRSLGYVTLTFPPTEGRSVIIQATGNARDEDAFGQVIEVTGNKEADGEKTTKSNAKAALTIHEVEIYEPAPAIR